MNPIEKISYGSVMSNMYAETINEYCSDCCCGEKCNEINALMFDFVAYNAAIRRMREIYTNIRNGRDFVREYKELVELGEADLSDIDFDWFREIVPESKVNGKKLAEDIMLINESQDEIKQRTEKLIHNDVCPLMGYYARTAAWREN